MEQNEELNRELIGEILAMLTVDIPVNFEDVLRVKKTPHIELFRCAAVVKNRFDVVVVYDGKDWYDVEPNQANVFYLLQSLKQRLTGLLK